MIHLQPAERETLVFNDALASAGAKHTPQHEEVYPPDRAHTPPSHNIPMPSTHIHRTRSELQLREDMAAAEWRDFCMFHRLVNGMRERQKAHIAAQQRQAQMRGYGDYNIDNSTVQTDPAHARQVKEYAFYESFGRQTPGCTNAMDLHDLSAVNSQRSGSTVATGPQARHEELQDVLHMASGEQFAAVGSDWSITGYDDTNFNTRATPFGGYGMPHVIAPDDDEADCEIFKLDM